MYIRFFALEERLMQTQRFIHLVRNNEDQAFSCIRNSSLRKQHKDGHQAFLLKGMAYQDATQEYEAPARIFKRVKNRIIQQRRQTENMLRNIQGRYKLEVSYEGITNGSSDTSVMPDKQARRICDFLQVNQAELTTPLIKIAPQEVKLISRV